MNSIDKNIEEGMILIKETKESSKFSIDDLQTTIGWSAENGFQYSLSYKKRKERDNYSFQESFNDLSLLRKRILELLYEALSENFKESFENIQESTREKIEFFFKKIEGK